MFTRILPLIDTCIATIGKASAMMVVGIIGVMTLDILWRAVAGYSLSWASDVSVWLMVGMIFLGGPWALARGHFVRVDALFERFSPRTKAILDTTVSSILFLLLVSVLVHFGTAFAMKSFFLGEVSSSGAWNGRVWIAKALVPAGSCLLCLAWISHLAHMWQNLRAVEEKAD